MGQSGWIAMRSVLTLLTMLTLLGARAFADGPALTDVGSSPSEATVTVSDAVLVQPPPGAPVIGGYLRLVSSRDDRLLGVTGTLSADIQLHSMSEEEGKMRMRRLDAIDLPAHTPVLLQRGGLHLMLMDPVQRPDVGAEVELTLHFEHAAALPVIFAVQDGRSSASDGSTDAEHDHGHDHSHH
jgi:copper(I)-binding protein